MPIRTRRKLDILLRELGFEYSSLHDQYLLTIPNGRLPEMLRDIRKVRDQLHDTSGTNRFTRIDNKLIELEGKFLRLRGDFEVLMHHLGLAIHESLPQPSYRSIVPRKEDI